MRKNIFISSALILFIALLSLLFGCVPLNQTPQKEEPKKIVLSLFTKKIIKEHNLTDEKLFKIQFFNGPTNMPIILSRKEFVVMDSIVNGKVKKFTQEKVYLVKIKTFTRGKLISISENTNLIISFEEGYSLVFGPENDGSFVLYSINGTNEVLYGNKIYQIISGGNSLSKLFINLEDIKVTQIKEKVTPGIIVQ